MLLLTAMENKTTNNRKSTVELLADKFTKWVGSISSLIVHTILFAFAFILIIFGANVDSVLLILTTIVSLEAIYLAIFIQMSVNKQSQSIQNVEENIDEIQEDIDEIQEDVDDIQEDIDEIQIDDEHEAKAEETANVTIDHIYTDLKKLVHDIERLKGEVGDIRKQ
jgi:peptidoglycan hydrolase CwlO-like protein